jgi:N-(2-amino-2-carboxyethyl)-L-glutamate synthase
MAVYSRPQDLLLDDVFVDIGQLTGRRVLLKCEGLNLAGSIKLKPAVAMVEAAERDGLLRPGAVIVESSSGNLGVALAIVAAHRGYRFVCVCDPRINETNRRLIGCYGGEILMVDEPDEHGGFLGTRMATVERLCREHADHVWLNQYANPHNPLAHEATTAPAVFTAFPRLDILFVGAGTTGTLMGCARYRAERAPRTRIIAVDSIGSVTFGGPAGPRFIPGLGTSRRPAQLDESLVDGLVLVDERDAVRTCRWLAAHGYLFGGSTGTVLAGALHVLAGEPPDTTAVVVAPDFGERYLRTVYDDAWVAAHLPGPAVPPRVVDLRRRSAYRRTARPPEPTPPSAELHPTLVAHKDG